MAYLLGIDIGTTSVSALVYDTAKREVAAVGSLPHKAAVRGLAAGRRELSPYILLSVTSSLLTALSAEIPRIDAISVTGQAHGYLITDAAGEPLCNFVTWEDRRVLERVEGVSWLEEFEVLFRRCVGNEAGLTVDSGYAAPALYMLARRNELPAGASKVFAIPDWLVQQLTAAAACEVPASPSCAHSMGWYLPAERRYAESLIAEMGISRVLLPEVVETGSPAGESRGSRLGVASGVPVYVGMGDNQAAFFGSVAEPTASVHLNVGTGSQMSVLVENLVLIRGLDLRPHLDGRFLLVGAPLCGGRAMELLKEFVSDIGRRFFDKELTDEELFAAILRNARPDTDLGCRVSFAGSRTRPDERGSFSNMSTENFTIADLSGALISGIAAELHELYVTAGVRRSVVVGSGNGLRRNRHLRQAVASFFGTEPRLPLSEEEAAFGAALTAGVGAGVYASFEEASREVRYR